MVITNLKLSFLAQQVSSADAYFCRFSFVVESRRRRQKAEETTRWQCEEVK